jgi:hypothetical protein
MKSIDEKIQEALSENDAELVESLRGERPLGEMINEAFRSRHRWMNITSFVMPMIFVVAACFFAYQFFTASTTHAMIGWATGFLWAVTGTGMFKIFFMMELNKNSVTREIKRLELELAQLSRQLADR